MNPFTPTRKLSKRSAKKVKTKEFQQQLKKGKIPKSLSKVFLLRQLKYELNENEADKIIDQLDESTYEFVIGQPIADSYEKMCKDAGVQNNELHKELLWIVRFLEEYSNELNEFVGLEKKYDRAMLLGDYDEAKNVINHIEQTITFSNWTIQQKIIIAEFEKGFKSNKKLLSTLLSESNSNITNFLSSYTSIRVEKNISPLQYDNILGDYTKVLDKGILDFVKFKVDYFKTFNYEDYGSILSIENRQSIIDQYIAFRQISGLLLCQNNALPKHKLGTVRQCIGRIINLINDPELRVLGTLSNVLSLPTNSDFDFLELADFYTSGNYTEAVVQGEKIIKANPKSFHAVELYCKALINIDQKPRKMAPTENIVDHVIGLFYQLIKKDHTFTNEVYANIYKFVHQLGNHPLAVGLYYILTLELPFRFGESSEINMFKYYLSTSQTLNPGLSQFIDPPNRKKYNEYLLTRKSSSSTINLIDEITQPRVIKPDKSFSVRRLKYLAIALENQKRFEESLVAYELIFASEEFKLASNNTSFQLDIWTGKYNCLIKAGRFEDALDIAVQALLKNEKFDERFYNPFLLHLLTNTDNPSLTTNVNLPIYLAFYKSNIETYDLYVAYDNFLESNGVSTPKDYIQKLNQVNDNDLCFLEKVCSHEVLHSSPSFENQEELDLERLEICSFLVNKTTNPLQIEAEISELWRKILVRKGIKQINYSKIYVDVPGLKESLRNQLKENFNRNIEIASLPVDQLKKIVDSLGNLLVYYFDSDEDSEIDLNASNKEEVKEQIKKLKFTSYNRFIHFREAFLKIRDQFISDKDHGLDTYLSMRIRHGTLLGQIRSVFETHRLITVKNETDNEYLPNEYWLEKFNDQIFADTLNNSLRKFSRAIDEMAEKLKAETIQIKTEKTKGNPGLFDYSYTEDNLLSLFQTKFGSIKDFEIFMEKVFEELWARTEICLTNIKGHLNGHMVRLLEEIFNEVEQQLSHQLSFPEQDPSSQAQQELIGTLRKCQTAIIVEMANISEWFNRSNKKIIEEFDFRLLIDSNVSTLQNVNPSFASASINSNINSDIIFDGDLFPYFTDILYYLLENAIKHSKLSPDELWIHIDVTETNGYIAIKISNNVLNDPIHMKNSREKITATKKKLESEKTYEDINKEGGTGFPKIKKTLKHDLKRKEFVIKLDLDQNTNAEPFFCSEIIIETAHLATILR